MDDRSTSELVTLARAGDHAAFAELYEQLNRPVARAVASRVSSPDDRAELVQETFALAWEKLGDLRDPERFVPWLYAIARNAATSRGRSLTRRGEQPLVEADEPVSDHHSPHDLVVAADLLAEVSRAGALLSWRDATVLSMVVNFGFGPAEIAGALGITENNAAVILHRARQRLRRELDVRTGRDWADPGVRTAAAERRDG